MKTRRSRAAAAGAVAFAVVTIGAGGLATIVAIDARGDVPLPPWIEEGEVPPPAWAQSVVRRPDDSALFGEPEEQPNAPGPRGRGGVAGATQVADGASKGLVLFEGATRASSRRGVSAPGTSLPFFGSKRGSGCSGVWWLVGPLAWTCSDDADLSADGPIARDRAVDATGLASRYMFVRSGGASAYASLESARDGEADEELEGGWAVSVVEERTADGDRWARTSGGLWLSLQDLSPARPSIFRGEKVDDGRLDFAWVRSDRALVWATAATAAAASTKDKPSGVRARFQVVRLAADHAPMVQTTDGAWMLASDLARPRMSPVPEGLAVDERWIDVDSASQTLVAYQGARPVYATLVSTGRGAVDATPTGSHRVWVKILASHMGNVTGNVQREPEEQHDDHDARYSLEDVPYVQFFDDAVGLHGTYWHGDFGRPRSHGCVNLSPLDARWMFDFTSPKMPVGWSAVYPTRLDPGTLVRVR